jgi:hypothetical protein
MRKICLMVVLFIVGLELAVALPPTKTSQGAEPKITGEEKWIIDGELYEIEGTMLVQVQPFPSHLFAIKVLVSEDPGAHHRYLAKKIAKYALDNNYYEKAKTKYKIGGKPLLITPKIGVAVIEKKGLFIVSSSSGYRFQFKLDELK